MSISPKAVIETRELLAKALELSLGTQSQRKEADVYLAQVASINKRGLSSDECRVIEREERARQAEAKYEELFRKNLFGELSNEQFEARCALEFRTDDQSVGYWGRPNATSIIGSLGSGYLVPPTFHKLVTNSAKQYAELMSDADVNFVQESTYGLPGKTFVGWDTAQFSAKKLSEVGTQTYGDTVQVGTVGTANDAVPAYGKVSSGQVFAVTLRAASEVVDDSEAYGGLAGGIYGSIAKTLGVAFGRKAAPSLVSGDGTAGNLQGLLTGASSAGVSAPLSFSMLTNTWFALNRAHRNAEKIRWVLSDATYKQLRTLQDDDHRPLISLSGSDGEERLFGAKILIAPEMPSYIASPLADGSLVVGDLQHFVVRASAMSLQRLSQRYADSGEIALHARLRLDSFTFDPNVSVGDGSSPAIIKASITG
jgi:HK97 family phage major capsid protein